jgi:outer membrane protein assembly factor BamB
VGGALNSAVTVGPFGELRVKSSGNDLLCLRSDGSVRWRRPLAAGTAAPIIDRFATAYLGTDDGRLHAVSRHGKLIYSVNLGGNLGSGLHYSGGAMVFPNTAGTLFFVETDGDVIASIAIGPLGAEVLPVLVNSRQLMAASSDGNLYEILFDPTTQVPSRGITLALPGCVSRSTPASDGQSVYVVTDGDVLVKATHTPGEPDLPGVIVWTFDPGSSTSSGGASPALGVDGTVYFGTQDGRLLAVDRFGSLLWTYVAAHPIQAAPLIDVDGNLYFRDSLGNLHSVDAGGQCRYVRRQADSLSSGVDSAPSMDADGNLYFGTHSGLLLRLGRAPIYAQVGHAPDHRGRSGVQGATQPILAWSVNTQTATVHPPLVFADGVTLVMGADGLARQFDRRGKAKGALALGQLSHSIVLGNDGCIYNATIDGRVVGRTRLGGILFERKLLDSGALSPLVIAADQLHVASSAGRTFQLTTQGEVVRELATAPVGDAAPTIGSDGELLLASTTARLQSFDVHGQLRFDVSLPASVSKSTPVLAGDGLRYVVTDREQLVAMDSDGVGRWVFDPQVSETQGGAGGPVLTLDGTVVYVTSAGVMHGRDPLDGSVRFVQSLSAGALQPSVVDHNGTLFTTTVDGRVHVQQQDGTLLYQLEPGAVDGALATMAPVLPGDRSLCLATDQGVNLLRIQPVWPLLQGTPDHRGRQALDGPLAPAVEWCFDTAGTLEMSAVLSRQSEILVRTTEAELIVLRDDGTLVYRSDVGPGPGVALPHPEDVHLVGSSSGLLTALDRSGAPLWFLSLGAPVSAMNLLDDGRFLVAAGTQLRAMHTDGSVSWTRPVGTVGEGTPAVGLDGRLYYAVSNVLLVLETDGTLVQSTPLPGVVSRSSVAMGADGTAYVTTDADVLVAVTKFGTVQWCFDPLTGSSQGGRSSPSLAADGTILFGAMDGFLYAVHADGTQRFAFDTSGPVRSAPLLDGAGRVYVGSDSGNLLGLDLSGVQRFSLPLGGALTSMAMDLDGSLLVGSSTGEVFRVKDP